MTHSKSPTGNPGAKIFRNNLDYEYALFDPEYKWQGAAYREIVRNFEYVYFLIQQQESTLCTEWKDLYSNDYLEHLSQHGLIVPQFKPHEGAQLVDNWWGPLLDLPLERKLNSKITSTTMARDLSLCHPLTSVVSSWDEFERFFQLPSLRHYPYEFYLLKSPYMMAGRGNRSFRKSAYKEMKVWWDQNANKGPFILEPRLSVVLELGMYFKPDLQGGPPLSPPLLHENILSANGTYRGSRAVAGAATFPSQADGRMSPLLEQLQESANKIGTRYYGMGARGGFGIDAFIYEEDGRLKLYDLLEVNYRKSMGLVLHSLNRLFLPAGGVGLWMVRPSSGGKTNSNLLTLIKNISPLLYSPASGTGLVVTSPPFARFNSFYLAAANIPSLEKMQKSLLDFLNSVH